MTDVFETIETIDDPPVTIEAGPLPPADEWADVDPDYRSEIYAELPTGPDQDLLADLDRIAAERLIKRYHRLSIEEREAVQFVDDEIARTREMLEALEARRQELLKPITRKRQWLDTFRPLLEDWARGALAGAKTKTLKLTYGAVRFRKSPDRLEINDETAALDWARTECRDAIKETVSKTALKDYVKGTGSVPPGCEWVAGQDAFSMETI